MRLCEFNQKEKMLQEITPGPEIKLERVPTFREVLALSNRSDLNSVQYRCKAWSFRRMIREFILMGLLWWNGWSISVQSWRPFEFTAKWIEKLDQTGG